MIGSITRSSVRENANASPARMPVTMPVTRPIAASVIVAPTSLRRPSENPSARSLAIRLGLEM